MSSSVKRRFWPALLSVHLLAAVAVGVQRLLSGAQINNFLIFRSAFHHLAAGQDLYVAYPAEHFDLYKYSPTFALLFAPFSLLPLGVSLVSWNLLNTLILCLAVRAVVGVERAGMVLAVCLLEALGAMQNLQSNGLVTGLMVATLASLERDRSAIGALAVVSGAAVKIFPGAAGLLGIMDRRAWRFLLWSGLLAVIFLALPLLVTPLHTLIDQYRSYGRLQELDRLRHPQMWIGGLLQQRGYVINGVAVQGVGLAILLSAAAYARQAWHDATVRRTLLALLLIFSNIFNHNAESPSYVIGITGLGIWWVSMPRARWRDVLLALGVVMGSLVASDITSKAFRAAYLIEWKGKAIVFTVVWCVLLVELVRTARDASHRASLAGEHGGGDVGNPGAAGEPHREVKLSTH